MDSIRQYILSVIAAALLCGIINSLVGSKKASGKIVKLLTGLFMVLTLVAPWTKFNLLNIADITQYISADAQAAVTSGEEAAQNYMGEIIKQQTESYILDKASSLGLDVEVHVGLNGDTPPTPASVTITGTVSPYSKSILSRFIKNDLAIPEENQTWM